MSFTIDQESDMSDLSVPFRSGHLPPMSLAEARRLRDDLDVLISREEASPTDRRLPSVSEDGFMMRSDFYNFFAQFYPDRGLLRNRAGRLFAALVKAADSEEMALRGFVVLCGHCRQHVSVSRCIPSSVGHHYSAEKQYLIDTVSLKECAESLVSYLRNKPAAVDDLKVLLEYLG